MRALFKRIRAALRADAAHQHAAYEKWSVEEEGVGICPVLSVETPAEGLRDDVADLIERLLDAQQDINLAANETMSQSLCDASAVIDEVEKVLRALASTAPAPLSGRNGSLREALEKSSKRVIALLNVTGDFARDQRWCQNMRGALADLNAALAAVPPETADMEGAVRDVLAERERQKTAEGCTPEHDDLHVGCERGKAASVYADPNSAGNSFEPTRWPWKTSEYKPRAYRPNLVRAGALILAEIERLDRVNQRKDVMK